VGAHGERLASPLTGPEHFSGRAELKTVSVISGRKILHMTIPLDAAGLNFRIGLGPDPGLGGPSAHFIV
jgi:hypothetical protein